MGVYRIDMIYQILYRSYGREEWWVHTSRKGTSVYTTLGAAKGALTQFRKQDKYFSHVAADTEYKIQKSPVVWEDM